MHAALIRGGVLVLSATTPQDDHGGHTEGQDNRTVYLPQVPTPPGQDHGDGALPFQVRVLDPGRIHQTVCPANGQRVKDVGNEEVVHDQVGLSATGTATVVINAGSEVPRTTAPITTGDIDSTRADRTGAGMKWLVATTRTTVPPRQATRSGITYRFSLIGPDRGVSAPVVLSRPLLPWPVMRRRFLIRSVERLLRRDESLVGVVFMWSRHRWMVPFAGCAFVGLVAVAGASEIADWSVRLGLGAVGATVAAVATTEYRVLALTTRSLVLCRGGRFRQVATGVIERLPDDVAITRVGTTLVTSEWMVGDLRYTVPRNFGPVMEAVAHR